jgi:hypothetical protein
VVEIFLWLTTKKSWRGVCLDMSAVAAGGDNLGRRDRLVLAAEVTRDGLTVRIEGPPPRVRRSRLGLHFLLNH